MPKKKTRRKTTAPRAKRRKTMAKKKHKLDTAAMERLVKAGLRRGIIKKK